ncbi:phosphodiesterase [Paenibacillus caui]|uniref:phosphodiesterase n=1 Tax=Paenibacillus caui TaxID=2873927 RepID=UPI001CA95285|nr:phosphodiesterase [Paenibacillus caui]
MKLMFISDIHGSAHWLSRALDKVHEEQADQIVMLGDFLYHGPRNPLPDGYNPGQAAEMLNKYKEKIVAVRGNCDAEVDQMLIEFPIMADYTMILHEGRRIYATHGHGYSMEHLPPLMENDVFIQGHTHIPVADRKEGVYLLNPGSIALPKENYPHSYGILFGDEFIVKDFDGGTVKRISFGS